MSNSSLGGDFINHYRSQVHHHERSLMTNSYVRRYRKKDTENSEDISEIFHENTMLNRVLIEASHENMLELGNDLAKIEAQVDPDFPNHTRVDLPDPPTLDADFATVLKSRRSPNSFSDGSFSGEQLSQCLFYSAGNIADESPSRTYPSPGGLYPSELFPILFDVDGFDPGIYYYNNKGHYLREMEIFENKRELFDQIRDCIHMDGIVPNIDTTCVLFLVSADFWRAKFKYGPRGYRYILQENGHLAQNILLTLTAMDFAGRPLAAFYDRKINDLIGLDGVNTAVLYMVAAGHKK